MEKNKDQKNRIKSKHKHENKESKLSHVLKARTLVMYFEDDENGLKGSSFI